MPDLGPPVPGPAPGPASLNQLNASLSTTKLPTTRPVSSSLPSAGGNPVVSRHFAQRSVDPTLLDGGRSASELQRREAGGEWDRPGVCSSRTADACSQKPESCAGPRTSPRGSYERRYFLSRCAKGQFIPPRPAALRTTAGPPPRGRPSDDVDLTPALARDAAASTDSFGTETGPRDGPEGMDDTSGVSLAPSVPLARKQVPSRLGKAGTNCDGSRAPRLKLVEPEARKTAEDSCVELDTGFMQSATGPARTPKHARDTRGPVPATWVRSRDALVKGAQRWAASTAGKPKRRLQRVYEDDNDGRCNSQSQVRLPVARWCWSCAMDACPRCANLPHSLSFPPLFFGPLSLLLRTHHLFILAFVCPCKLIATWKNCLSSCPHLSGGSSALSAWNACD